jgi:hypothetical protein
MESLLTFLIGENSSLTLKNTKTNFSVFVENENFSTGFSLKKSGKRKRDDSPQYEPGVMISKPKDITPYKKLKN